MPSMRQNSSMLSERILSFNRSLRLNAKVPTGIAVMNPFKEEGSIALQFATAFYTKYYHDNNPRWSILGINPGRHGAALSGVPFTDFKRLRDECGIDVKGHTAHEPSSEFIYKMIAAMGGVDAFYSNFYINSICPLGFVKLNASGRWVNYNYYDQPDLYEAVKPFIIKNIKKQIDLGLHTEVCFSLGRKNAEYLTRLNDQYHFFNKIIELPHPRFVVQYKRKEMDTYIDEYVAKLSTVLL